VDARLIRLLTAVDARLRCEAAGGGGGRPGTCGPASAPPTYLVFPRQAPAFAAADGAPPAAGLRVFSIEHAGGPGGRAGGGSRSYVVCSLPELWRRYRAADPADRRHYEILRDGAPAHLYLDIEFKRVDASTGAPINAHIDGDALVDAVVAAVAARLRADHGVRVAAGDVLELDASSARKFSRHVTVRVGGVAFASTADVGALVRAALADPPPAWRLGEAEEEEEDGGGGDGGGADEDTAPATAAAAATTTTTTTTTNPPPLHVDDAYMVVKAAADAHPSTPAVDLAVYSRNRAWRMAGSAKAGDAERRVLVPTGRYGGAGASDRAVFFGGLAGDVAPGVRLIERDDAVLAGARRCGGGGGGRTAAATTTDPASAFSIRPGPSPLPLIDAFIEGVAARASAGAGGPVSVRAWALWAGDTDTTARGLVLALRNGRFCGRIGRPHASNGVFYVVDAAAGHYHQRCYDPECRGYRSPAMPLPADVWKAARAAVPGLLPPPPRPPPQQQQPQQHGGEAEDDEDALVAEVARIEAAALAARAAAAAGCGGGAGRGDPMDDDNEACWGGEEVEALLAAVEAGRRENGAWTQA
jgi:hypothetical protein